MHCDYMYIRDYAHLFGLTETEAQDLIKTDQFTQQENLGAENATPS